MKALLITDQEYQTETFELLNRIINNFLDEKGFEVKLFEIGRNDLSFCMGCFGCWVKTPGECVIDDLITEINRAYINSDVTIILSPIVFGQFSANIKSVRDRWIPNILPFFKVRPDGSTMHPARYSSYPKQIIIGYGDDLLEEDLHLFTKVTKKHLRNIEVLVFQGSDQTHNIVEALDNIELKKAGAAL